MAGEAIVTRLAPIVVAAWTLLAAGGVAAAIRPATDGDLVALLALALAALAASVKAHGRSTERSARAGFVLAMAAIIAPGSFLDATICGSRAKWGLIGAAFAWLGRQCMQPTIPFRDFDRWRLRVHEGCVVGTVPAVLAGLAEGWAVACAILAAASLVYDGHIAVFLPIFLLGFAFTVPHGAHSAAAFSGLHAITALAMLGPYLRNEP